MGLYLLFLMLFSFQVILDLGFSPTFSREINYAFARVVEPSYSAKNGGWERIGNIYGTMKVIYRFTSIALLILLISAGTYFIAPSIQRTANDQNWFGWLAVVIVSTIYLYGNKYVAYLNGCNQVALIRRWEMFTSLLSTITAVFVLYFGGRVLGLIMANQFWMLISVIVNRRLARNMDDNRWSEIKKASFSRAVFSEIFPQAWKSALGIIGAYGVVQSSGIIFSRLGEAGEVASYLLALRALTVISNLSGAPFYSKIPTFNMLYSAKRKDDLLKKAHASYWMSLWAFVTLALIIGYSSEFILDFIGSETQFVPSYYWSIIILGVFAERYGALHIQLYTCTNHVIWHKSNGISGMIFIFTSITLFHYLGYYSFALAYIIANIGFYAWYNAMHSYRAYQMSFLKFESYASIAPFIILVINFVYQLINTFF